MAGISQLTNLSQQQFNQGLNPESTMRQANQPVFQADTSKVNDLAKDLTGIIKGIENYKQIKHNLSVDATKKLALDHKTDFIIKKNQIIGQQEVSEEDKKQQLTELAVSYQDAAAEHISDDKNLQDIYDESFTNYSKVIYSENMVMLDKSIYNRDVNIQKENLDLSASLGSSVTPKELIDNYNTLIKNNEITEEDVYYKHITGIANEFNSFDIASSEANKPLYKAIVRGTKIDRNTLNSLKMRYFGSYLEQTKNGSLVLKEEFKDNKVLKSNIDKVFDNTINQANRYIEKIKNKSSEGFSKSISAYFKKSFDKIIEKTGVNGENIDINELNKLEQQVNSVNITPSQKIAIEEKIGKIRDNIAIRNDITEVYNGSLDGNIDSAIDLNSKITNGYSIRRNDGSLIIVGSDFVKAELNNLYARKEKEIKSIQDPTARKQETMKLYEATKSLDIKPPFIKRINSSTSQLDSYGYQTAEDLIEDVETSVSMKSRDSKHSGETSSYIYSRVKTAYEQGTKDKLTGNDLLVYVNNARYNAVKEVQNDIAGTNKKYVNNFFDNRTDLFWGLNQTVTDNTKNVASEYLIKTGKKFASENAANEWLNKNTARTEGFMSTLGRSVGQNMPWNNGDYSEVVLNPMSLEGTDNEDNLIEGVDRFVGKVLNSDIDNYTISNAYIGDKVYVTVTRKESVGEEKTYYLGSDDLSELSVKDYTDSISIKFKKKLQTLIEPKE